MPQGSGDRCKRGSSPQSLKDARGLPNVFSRGKNLWEYLLGRFVPVVPFRVDQNGLMAVGADLLDKPCHNVNHMFAVKRTEVAKRGALVSIIYERTEKLTGDSRHELPRRNLLER